MIIHNLRLRKNEMKNTAAIIKAMQRHIDGHINETVECRNFQRRMQHPGEPFDDFLISLRELAKICKYYSESCMQKSIRNQVIEALNDGDTVEDLLQESNLILGTTITKCQSREAAKKHRTEMATQGTDVIAALHKPQQSRSVSYPGCGGAHHRGGHSQCQHLIKPATIVTRWPWGISLKQTQTTSQHISYNSPDFGKCNLSPIPTKQPHSIVQYSRKQNETSTYYCSSHVIIFRYYRSGNVARLRS